MDGDSLGPSHPPLCLPGSLLPGLRMTDSSLSHELDTRGISSEGPPMPSETASHQPSSPIAACGGRKLPLPASATATASIPPAPLPPLPGEHAQLASWDSNPGAEAVEGLRSQSRTSLGTPQVHRHGSNRHSLWFSLWFSATELGSVGSIMWHYVAAEKLTHGMWLFLTKTLGRPPTCAFVVFYCSPHQTSGASAAICVF